MMAISPPRSLTALEFNFGLGVQVRALCTKPVVHVLTHDDSSQYSTSKSFKNR
jgi:hypothetical protein